MEVISDKESLVMNEETSGLGNNNAPENRCEMQKEQAKELLPKLVLPG